MNRLHHLGAALVLSCTAATALAVAPTSAIAAVAPTASHRGGQFDGTLGVSDATPAPGDVVYLKGHIRAAAPHSQAVLQVLYDNRTSWKSVDRDRMNRYRHYRFAEKITTDRSREYRVVVAPGHGRSRLQSKLATVTPQA